MPAAYQHLRVRLRIEQTRLLNWGEKIGLIEEKLDDPSRVLQLNRNLIIDILLEVQTLFRSCVAIQDKFDQLVPQNPTENDVAAANKDIFNRRFPKGTNTMLSKTLGFLEKAPEVPRRLQWAVVKKDRFEGLVEKLIHYNTSIEALLDSTAIDQLQMLQQQTYMAMLQLNSDVVELKEISLALQIRTKEGNQGNGAMDKATRSNIGQVQDSNQATFSRLADFKAQQMQLEANPSVTTLDPIPMTDIALKASSDVRSEASYRGKRIWIEWKQYASGHNTHSKWILTIEDRIKKLAILLGSDNKPPQFNAPQCLGYFKDSTHKRYGFLYAKPSSVPPKTTPTSLLNLIHSTGAKSPSVTKRIALAHAVARCLMYLHSVNWLHKGLRSNNIIFFTPPGEPPTYSHPLIAGFDYARPDFPDEETEPPPEHSDHDIYRHPAILARTASRSQKSHDIYSLGVVLVEIAYWKPIDEVMEMPRDARAARSRVKRVRDLLLNGEYLDGVAGRVGEVYVDAVRKCLAGGVDLGIEEGANEGDVEVGARMQEIFAEDVVGKLRDVKI